MANEDIYIVKLAAWLIRVLGQGGESVSQLNFGVLSTLPTALDVPSARQAIGGVGASLVETSAELEDAVRSQDGVKLITSLIKTGDDLIHYYQALNGLVDEITHQIESIIDPTEQARAQAWAQAFALTLAREIADYAIITAIETKSRRLALLLRVLGLIESTRVEVDPGNPLSPHYVKKVLHLERVKDLISNPSQHLTDSIGWGTATFDPMEFFRIAETFYSSEDTVEVGRIDGKSFIKRGIFELRSNPPGLELDINAALQQPNRFRVDASEKWGVGLDTTLTFDGGVTITLSPPLSASFKPLAGVMGGKFRLYADRNEAAQPFDIIGGTPLVSLSAKNVSVGVGLDVEWDSASATGSAEPFVFSEITGAVFKLGSSDADSFIGSLLAAVEIEGQFDLGFEWSPNTGLRITSSGGVEIALPIHRQIGPLEFQVLYLALTIQNDGTLSLEVSAALAGALGPLTAVVDRIGVILDLKFVGGTDGAFGPFDLGLRFKPPQGIGLGIDAGVVKGGGYVDINVEEGSYAGILTLTIAEFLSVTAIGLINTRLPGGQPGFSLLLIITAEFVPGVQLGYGFTLSGVGGLLGLNRAMLLDPLAERVRTGAVNSILFPTNVIANATRIISDLRAIFPPQEGTFLIGPMAKIGWGTPNLISVSLGIIIEIPGDVVILGRIRSALPIEQAPVLVLQVTFVGALEFTKRRLWFYATLFESQLLFIPLEGEMGLLMDFSDNPNFVLSVGGFHPDFRPPPLPFPTPARVGMSLINESDARIRAEAYFAVTTNSVQIGCSLDALFRFDAFNVDGEVSFDAILRFSPFHLEANLSAHFSVDVFGIAVFSVHLRGSIEGPTPWRVRGTAEIDTPLYKQSIDVDIPFGEERSDRLPSIAVLPQMKLEFEKQESWRTTLPAVGQLFVNLRNLDEPDLLVLHPIGTLQISQRFAPLNLSLSKIGNQEPSDVKKISVSVQAGQPGQLGEKGPMREKFSVGQFRDLSDAAKLSAAAFEPMDSGLELAAAGQSWTTGPGAKRSVRHEQVVLDSAFDPEPKRLVAIPSSIYWHHAAGAAVCRAAVSLTNRQLLQPFASKITTSADQFTIALQRNNQPAGLTFNSYAEAESHLAADMEANPSLAETVHIIPSAEVALAG